MRSETKRSLRAEALRAARKIPLPERAGIDRAITDRLLSLDIYRAASTVFCFVGFGLEIDTGPILRDALASGKRLCVPLCGAAGEMTAREIADLGELSPGAYGIPEPPCGSALVEWREIELAVVPCAACSRDGARLGRGGGYYDRALAVMGGTSAAICREAQIFESIPTEPHDVRVSLVITERAAYEGGREL